MFKFIIEAYDYEYYFFYNLRQEVKKFKRFMIQLPSLLRMAYNASNDVDWSVILSFLEYKIKRVRNHTAEHKHFVGWENNVEQMNKFLTLMDEATTYETPKELA